MASPMRPAREVSLGESSEVQSMSLFLQSHPIGHLQSMHAKSYCTPKGITQLN